MNQWQKALLVIVADAPANVSYLQARSNMPRHVCETYARVLRAKGLTNLAGDLYTITDAGRAALIEET